MWKQEKDNRSGVIINLKYEDFAQIEVIKRANSNGIFEYEVNFHIEDVTDQSIVAYKISDVTKVLENVKPMIEDLYDDFDSYSEKDIYLFLDDFVETINDF